MLYFLKILGIFASVVMIIIGVLGAFLLRYSISIDPYEKGHGEKSSSVPVDPKVVELKKTVREIPSSDSDVS